MPTPTIPSQIEIVVGISPDAINLSDYAKTSDLVSASGDLNSNIIIANNDVNSINGLTGAALITGAGNVTVSSAGQTVTISGASEDLSSYALISSLNATGNALNASITVLQGQTGTYYPRTNPSGYQTAADVTTSLSPYLTSATAASSYYPISNPSGYFNSASGVVMTTGNQTISGNKKFVGLLTGTLGSISLTAAKMYDSSNRQSVDWSIRNLLDVNQNNTLDWWYRELRTSTNFVSFNWDTRRAFNSAGSAVIDWEDETLNEGPGTLSVDWGNRRLCSTTYSNGLGPYLDWEIGQLFDTNGNTAIDWYNHYFNSSWDFSDGATSSNLGTDWDTIGGTELVTRGAVDQSKLDALTDGPGIVELTCFGGGDIQTFTNGGGTVSNGEGSSRGRTHGTALSYGISNHPLTSIISLANGDAIYFGQPLFFGVMYNTPGADYRKAGTTSYIYAGAAYNYLPSSDPTTIGFGWKIQQQTITPIFYKTSLISGTPNTFVLSAGGATRQQLWLAIYSDGAGNVSWYINGTLQYTTSVGPVAQGGTNNCYAAVGIYGNGTQASYGDCAISKLEFGKPR